MKRADALTLAGLVLLAAALRVPGLTESLVGDELFLLRIVEERSFGNMLLAVRDIESTPPLGFILSWGAAQLGDPTLAVRLPFFAAGVASVPAVFLLGRRTVGRRAGLLGAALFALAPMAIFYSNDARAYALVALLSACSTLALLAALDHGGFWRWCLFAVATVAALYTHYTVVFVLVAQAGWAAFTHREKVRGLALACVAALIAYLPWVPAFLVQRRDSAANRIEALYPLTPRSTAEGLLKLFPGEPYVPLSQVPGAPALVLLGAAVTAGAYWVIRRRPPTSREHWLLVALATVTPAAAVLYSLGPQSIFLSRNLIASLPAVCVIVAVIALAPPRWWRAFTVGAVLVALTVAAVTSVSPDTRRAPYNEVADRLDQIARPSETVIDVNFGSGPLRRSLATNFERPHVVVAARGDNRAALRRVLPGQRAFLVYPVAGAFAGAAPKRFVPKGFRLERAERFRGSPPLELLTVRRTLASGRR